MTFPGGTHDLWIRYWLAAGGIDPDKDVSTIVVPPPQMVANMKVGNMDAFCVGEPWNEQLVNQDIGYTALTTGELWFKHPEKILGMRADWVDAQSEGHARDPDGGDGGPAVVREDGEQAGDGRDRRPPPVVQRAGPRHHRPHQGRHQLRPRPHRQGHQPADEVLGREGRGRPIPGRASTPGSSPRTSAGASSSRPSTSRRSSTRPTASISGSRRPRRLASPISPTGDSRGVETFFDGKVFDPTDRLAYLRSLSIKRVVV